MKEDESAIRLTYWNGYGRCEPIRLLLAAGKVNYKNVYVKGREHFLQLQNSPDTLYSQIPLLEMDGLKMVQSRAIIQYLGKKFNLIGESLKDTYNINVALEGILDFRSGLTTFPFISDEVKATIPVAWKTPNQLPRFFGAWDRLLSKTDSGYFTHKLSVAEICLCGIYYFMMDILASMKGPSIEETLKQYPAVIACVKKTLGELPSLQAYLDTRKFDSWEDYKLSVGTSLGR